MQSACVAPGGGKYATTLFAKSGFSLTRVQRKKALCAR